METVYTGDSLTGIEGVSGLIGLYMNDGFLLREDDPSDYLRQIIRSGAITLSNYPEGYVPPPTIEQRVGELEQTNSIAFVVLAENGEISEETAAAYPDLFPEWESGVQYDAGNLRAYHGVLYKCLIPHTSQDDWTPDVSPSLWAIAADPTQEWPEWVQPLGSEDAYKAGDKVSHNDKHWISDVNANIWEPGVYGWTEASET